MTTESKKPTEEALLDILDIQWRDHFQTRGQTWKALEITALVAVALVGLDWRFGKNRLVTIVTACLLAIVAMFAMQITIRHRNKAELTKFKIITHVSLKSYRWEVDKQLLAPVAGKETAIVCPTPHR